MAIPNKVTSADQVQDGFKKVNLTIDNIITGVTYYSSSQTLTLAKLNGTNLSTVISNYTPVMYVTSVTLNPNNKILYLDCSSGNTLFTLNDISSTIPDYFGYEVKRIDNTYNFCQIKTHSVPQLINSSFSSITLYAGQSIDIRPRAINNWELKGSLSSVIYVDNEVYTAYTSGQTLYSFTIHPNTFLVDNDEVIINYFIFNDQDRQLGVYINDVVLLQFGDDNYSDEDVGHFDVRVRLYKHGNVIKWLLTIVRGDDDETSPLTTVEVGSTGVIDFSSSMNVGLKSNSSDHDGHQIFAKHISIERKSYHS